MNHQRNLRRLHKVRMNFYSLDSILLPLPLSRHGSIKYHKENIFFQKYFVFHI